MSNPTDPKTCPQCHAPVPADAPEGLCPKCVLAGAARPTETGMGSTSTAEIPSLQRVAAAFPHLEILELIGRGGMGFVFKARQPHLDRLVALKLMPDKLARDPHFTERFNREGRVLARLNHPNIVTVFDFGRAGDFYFLMMEYVDGVNLRQAMRAARFSPTEALMIVPKICEALQFAHEQGVLHRDIKPENILLDARGRVKIADFGIAKLVEEDAQAFSLTATGAALGTPHYMAPEQLERPTQVDHRADIYSLGVVFYEMLTGELPLGRFGPPSSRTPLDRRVDEIVMRALERERELRQENAGQLKREVERVTSDPHGRVEAGRESPPSPAAFPAKGPAGTVVMPATSAPVSRKAVTAAALVGASLPVTFMAVVVASVLKPNVFPEAAVLGACLSIAALLAMVGTVLGWVSLNDIRAHRGGLRGLMLGAFAALAWPLLILTLLTIVLPYFALSVPGGTAGRLPIRGGLLVVIPVITLAAGFWVARATLRWGRGESISAGRGGWRIAGLVLTVVVAGLITLSVTRRHRPEPTADLPFEAVPSSGSSDGSVHVQFSVASEQVATFEVFHADTEPRETVPLFCGFLTGNSGTERTYGEFILQPYTPPPPAGSVDPGAWTLRLAAHDGAQTSGPIVTLGELIPVLPTEISSRYELPPGGEVEIPLTVAYPQGSDTNGISPRPRFHVLVRSHPRAGHVAGPSNSVASLGTTNWGETLTQLGKTGRFGRTETDSWMRFTITAVEMREEEQTFWMTIDYVSEVHGDCQRTFRWLGPEGFRGQLRTTEFVVGEPDKPLHHQRMETRLPKSLSREDALRARDSISKELLMKSIVLRLGEERCLFNVPIEGGTLSTWVGIKQTIKPSEQ